MTRSRICRLLGAVALASATSSPAPALAQEPRPNVIVVMTDDQTVNQVSRRTMPATLAALGDGGATFSSSVVSSPLCCPSRAGFLTGSYAHNNGVFDNVPGYPALTGKGSTLFTWLQESGYRTGHVGRYLLEYPREPASLGGALGPPGVDDWFGYLDGQINYYNALFSDNGFTARAGFDPLAGYTTEVINRESREFVAESAPAAEPFFLWVAHVAPHTANTSLRDGCGAGTPVPEPGALAPFAAEPLPRPPSFNEKRISDKPLWVATRRRIQPARLDLLRRGWRCALASLSSVDRGVAGLLDELRLRGELDDTAIFFTSDNGLLFGEHRLVQAKSYPYEETLRVPLLASVPPAYLGLPPGSPPAGEIAEPVTNLDLTATILELTSTAPCTSAEGCRSIDGRSFVPLLRGEEEAWPEARGTLVEIGNRNCVRDPTPPNGLPVFYDAIRTPRFLYVEMHHIDQSTGLCDRDEWELYNLRRDPSQLDNIAVNPTRREPSAVQAGLAARLATLRNCAGIAERDAGLTGRAFCE